MKFTDLPTLDGKLSPMTRFQRREAAIAMSRPASRPAKKVSAGTRWVEASTGDTVIYCGNCCAPVVNSVEGRLRHGQMRGDACARALRLAAFGP